VIKRPILFFVIPLILICIALSFYFQVAYLLDISWTNFYQVHRHITLPNWCTIALLVTTATMIYRGHHSTKWLIPITILMVAWNNYLVSAYGHNFNSMETTFGSLFFPLIFAPLYTKKYRRIISDRRFHWWETSPRKNHQAYVAINPFVSSTINSRTYDVSKSGLFVEINDIAWEQLPKVGERVNLSICLDTLRKVRCEAVVVRTAEATGQYPRGMGLHFTELTNDNRRTLNSFLEH
jgi:hypothetical protein